MSIIDQPHALHKLFESPLREEGLQTNGRSCRATIPTEFPNALERDEDHTTRPKLYSLFEVSGTGRNKVYTRICGLALPKEHADRVYRQALAKAGNRVLRIVPGPASQGFEKTIRKTAA